MKSPSWPQVALFTVLLSAIIVSHVWAPSAAAAVVSLVATIVGYFLGDGAKLVGGAEDTSKGGK